MASKIRNGLVIVGLAVALAVAKPAWSTPINYDFVSLYSVNTALSTFGVDAPSLNNQGQVAYVRSFNGTSKLVVNNSGSETIIGDGSGIESQDINDNGSIVVLDHVGTQLDLIKKVNGTIVTETLATGADYSNFETLPTINNSDQVAEKVTTRNTNDREIVRFENGLAPVVIDTAATNSNVTGARFNFSGPDINDSGTVAYVVQENSGSGLVNAVYTGTGGVVTNEGDVPGYIGNPSINNDGLIAVLTDGAVTVKDGQLTTIGGSAYNSVGGDVGVGINNYGQVVFDANARVAGNNNISYPGLFTGSDPATDKIIEVGDSVLGGTVNEIRFLRGNVNDFGQTVFLMNNDVGGQNTTSYIVRADPRGLRPDFALQPDSNPSPGTFQFDVNIDNALGVQAPIYLDPEIAVGYDFSVAGGKFASVVIPDALPHGDNTFTIEFDTLNGMVSRVLTAGTEFNFTSFMSGGIDFFSIGGINQSEMLDPSAPFTAGLTFVDNFQGTVTMQALTVNTGGTSSVPEPATITLFAFGLAGLGYARRRRRAYGA